MSLRSRRAMMPRSTSASTTTRPDTMCSPPANRSSEATSARRALTEFTTSRLSSSLTSAVIATGRHLSVRPTVRRGVGTVAAARGCRDGADAAHAHPVQRRRQLRRVM